MAREELGAVRGGARLGGFSGVHGVPGSLLEDLGENCRTGVVKSERGWTWASLELRNRLSGGAAADTHLAQVRHSGRTLRRCVVRSAREPARNGVGGWKRQALGRRVERDLLGLGCSRSAADGEALAGLSHTEMARAHARGL